MFVTLGVVALVAVVKPSCVYACSCIQPGPPAEALTNASAVFSGQVQTISAVGNSLQVTFTVKSVWKGTEQATIVVNTPTSSASCGVEFVQGQEYLVYADEAEGQLQTNLCSRTAQLAAAGEDIAALGDGKAPSAPAGGVGTPTTLPEAGSTMAYLLPATGGVLLIVALGAVVVMRRRRSA
jgi:LPXTG-motif cell wall-anchored protein